MKAFFAYQKRPRKIKKAVLGIRLNKNKLRKLLSGVKVIPATNGYDCAEILPYPFCPKCGCTWVRFGDNKAQYPERWVSGYCARCGNHVVESDNSPYYHALECEGFEIY